MGAKRRVAIMIGLDWPVGHHHQVFAGVLRFARENSHWECLINPYADLLFSDPKRDVGLNGIVARATPRLADLATKSGVPVVNVWQNSAAQGLPCVFNDVEEAGRMGARHLLARGFRSFGFLGIDDLPSNHLQLAGFQEVIGSLAHPCSACWVDHAFDHTATNWQRFQEQLGRWMDGWQKPIGVMVSSDLLCRYVAEACRERNLAIPQSVALVGSGNEVLVSTATHPTLSSIDYGFERIGHQAAALLNNLMDGKAPPKKPLRLAPESLVIRQSTDAFVVDDPLVAQALRFISDHVHLAVNVEMVADHVATTRRTLSRRFHSSLGRTIHDTITQLRLERVKKQLIETKVALKTIAVECGFRDAIHLCKVFQRVERTSPSEYRTARTVH